MVDHIYGRFNLIKRTDRPNMFAKELNIYIDYLKEQIADLKNPDKKSIKGLEKFKSNLFNGIEYYNSLTEKLKGKFDHLKNQIQEDIAKLEQELKQIKPLS